MACPFQIPPVPASATSGPAQFSARAAKTATPAGSDRPEPVLTNPATSHGAFSSSVVPTPVSAVRVAPGYRPTSSTATTTRASSPPVGVIADAATASNSRRRAPRSASRTPIAARTNQGNAAYATNSPHCPISSRSARYGVHAYPRAATTRTPTRCVGTSRAAPSAAR